jgi:CHAT domain-containing protein/predicted negative regulator of RcsB-dependent stress response
MNENRRLEMRVKKIKKGIKTILTIFLFLSLTAFVFSQDKESNEDQKLREEIIAVYQSKGEQGLRDFFKKNKKQITNKFILDFSEEGVKERKEDWLKVCEIIAKEKKDEKTLADILYKLEGYFREISDYKQASDYLDKAIKIYIKLNDLVGQGNVYFSKGEIHLMTGSLSNADNMYDKALKLFEKKGEKKGQGNVFRGKGDIYLRKGNYSNANEMYDKALIFFKQVDDISKQGNILRNKGTIYSIYGNYQMAHDMYDKAFLLFEKAKDIRGQGNVYWSKGEIFFRSNHYPDALNMYDKALSLFQEVKDPLPKANVYWRKGNIYFYSGDNSNALEMYEKALSLFKKSREPVGQGNLYFSKGDVYLYTGKYNKALEMYEKALHLYKKGGEPRGQGNIYFRKGQIHFLKGETASADMMYDKALPFFEKTGALLGQGNIFMNKGNIYLRKGYNINALNMFDKALLLFDKAGSFLDQGNIYHMKGEIFSRIGDYSKALEMYDKAMDLFIKINNPMGLANVYIQIGNIYHICDENSKALEMYDKAMPLYEKMEFQIGIGNVYRDKGDIFFKTSNYSRALELYDKAANFFEKLEEPLGLGCIYKTKGIIFFINGKISMSLELYEKAIKIFNNIGEMELESFTLQKKAMAVIKQGKRKEALNLLEDAFGKLEKIRDYTPSSEMKEPLMEKVYDQYKETVLFMLENKFYEKGFKCAESMRARVFLDQMAEGLVMLEKGLKSELREERDKLVEKISALTRQMQETGVKNEKRLQELKDKYRREESQFEDLLIKIRLENPLYASVNYPQPVSVRDLQKDVLKKGETLLSYFISPKKTYAFIASRENFKVKQLKVKENEINGYVERYLLSIKENNTNDMNRFGSILYEKLFKPLKKYLNKRQYIIIVPSGKLETIPFESLIVSKKKQERPVYLLEKYRLKYVQSASLLSILRKHYIRNNETQNFIGFGDPVYDYENFKQGKLEQGSITRSQKDADEIKEIHRNRYARAGGIMDRLPHSGEEIKIIAQLFEKESLNRVVYLREQAVEENAKAPNMKDFAYIHFSCHGLLNDDFQSLVLSQLPPEKSKEDGYFTLNEIMNCDYNAKLVVLSACQTGSGKMYKGEGVTGLTRAVMYAGTPAVIASLWKVDDTATKELMVRFYRNMLEKNLDKAEALRQAKLELLKEKKYSSPLFWSAFVLYGE